MNEFGRSGSRVQGGERAFNVRDATSYLEHVQLSGSLPFPVEDTGEISPRDFQEAISFIANGNTQDVSDV